METIQHRNVTVNGINMHIAELGQGPIILFIHGFPQLWYAWRHQMVHVAGHGYRAVAPDLRGFGDTTGVNTDDVSSFTSLHIVGDLVALIDALAPEQGKVHVVAHDWGAVMAWALCLYRPDKVESLLNMSAPFSPRNPNRKPIDTLRAVYGDDYYICRFQKPGEIEAEFAKVGTKRVIKKFLTYHNPDPLYLPKGTEFPDNAPLPSWLPEEDVDYYTNKYDHTGFTGPLNYYRALNLNWDLTAAWTKARVKVPVKFIVGEFDLTYNAPGAKDYINKGGLKKDVPLLKEVVVIEGAGHFVQEEKSDLVNNHILQFVKQCSPVDHPRSWCTAS
jgi:pimeloyl-ACP methyl ester carboxylesterase